MIERLKAGKVVNLRNFSTEGREVFVERLKDAIQELADKTRAIDGTLTVKCVIGGDWKTIQKQLTPEEFKTWMSGKFKAEKGKFLVDYTDRERYKLSDGDQVQEPPAFVFDALQVLVCPKNHKPGGNFSKYYYAGTDPETRRVLLEEFQIPPPPPWDAATLQRLLVPCVIYALTRHEMTERQRRVLTGYLESRLLTRYLPMASLAFLAEEFNCQIEVFTPDEKPIAKYSAHGLRYTEPMPDGGWHKINHDNCQNGRLFGTKDIQHTDIKRSANPKQAEYYTRDFKLVLWEDHYYCWNPEYRGLLEQVKPDLRPLNVLQANVWGTLLPRPVFKEPPVWTRTFFKTPEQMLQSVLLGANLKYRRMTQSSDVVQNAHIDSLPEHLGTDAPKVALKLFIEELLRLGLDDVLADSGTVKYFLRQSVKGATFELTKPCHVEEPVVMLDRNSNHPFALSQIALPRGVPRKGIPPPGAIGCVVTSDGTVMNTIDLGLHPEVRAITGWYWVQATEPGVLKPFMERLYAMRASNAEVKQLLNCMYGKLIEKPEPTMHVRGSTDTVRTSPLMKEFEDTLDHDGTVLKRVYQYYNDLDYTYNYTMIASLLLAQQRKNMRDVERLCKEHDVPIYYKAADCIAIPERCLPVLQHLIGTGLGQFKIEARGSEATFVRPGLYCVGDHVRGAVTRADVLHAFAELL